ncbi:uncharacterized protein LOC131658179 [Vicia villosa]|uniref:uncharacterized protein LOC131658179 n=1 Tax=Vicia villosa TaxID=3911 RepID=UPI00273B0123|nr:uncharacterized protein LOC131658179 [Vicia villosa]
MLQLCGPDPGGFLVDFTPFFTTDTICFTYNILAWAQFIDKQHNIIVVTIRSDTANEMRGRKDKLIMYCERGGKHKNKNVIEGNYTMKVKCSFKLRYVPSESNQKVTIKCGFHNHILAKDLDEHDVLGHLKDYERKFVTDMKKYNMAPGYIVVA